MECTWSRKKATQGTAPKSLGRLVLAKFGYEIGRTYEEVLNDPMPEPINELIHQIEDPANNVLTLPTSDYARVDEGGHSKP